MTYALIVSRDDGKSWHLVDADPDRDRMFIQCSTCQKAEVGAKFEVKCVDDHLYAALTAEKPVVESFF